MTAPKSKRATDSTRASYDRIARTYLDRHRDPLRYRKDLDVFSNLLDAPAFVLDIGSGPGLEAEKLRARGFQVVCVDLSFDMLSVGSFELPGARVQADMRSLPFGCVAGGIWAAACLHHLKREDVPTTLDEFNRVLVAGGILYVCVKQGTGTKWDTRYGECAPRFFTFWELEELAGLLGRAGFEPLEARIDQTRSDTWISIWARRTQRCP